MTIQDRQQAINNYLNVHGRALFEDLLDNDSHPIVAAVTFMALLEMIKTDELVFRQSELFGPIWIYRKKNNPEYADEMARETVFFSKDPDVKSGLVEVIRNEALARSQAGSVGDIAAVMKEAVLWTSRGRNVTEEDLQAMLEGREDLSEVQDDPFSDMLREEGAAGQTAEQPAAEQGAAEQNAADPAAEPAAETVAEPAASTDTEAPAEPATSVEEQPAAEKPADTSKMSDEEFEAFMKKAQAYYSGKAADESADDAGNENIAEDSGDDEDEFPSLEVHSGDD